VICFQLLQQGIKWQDSLATMINFFDKSRECFEQLKNNQLLKAGFG
jgi:hypothetical protein